MIQFFMTIRISNDDDEFMMIKLSPSLAALPNDDEFMIYRLSE